MFTSSHGVATCPPSVGYLCCPPYVALDWLYVDGITPPVGGCASSDAALGLLAVDGMRFQYGSPGCRVRLEVGLGVVDR